MIIIAARHDHTWRVVRPFTSTAVAAFASCRASSTTQIDPKTWRHSDTDEERHRPLPIDLRGAMKNSILANGERTDRCYRLPAGNGSTQLLRLERASRAQTMPNVAPKVTGLIGTRNPVKKVRLTAKASYS
jgi:hypothetical protein